MDVVDGDGNPDLVVVNREDRVVRWNRRLEELYGSAAPLTLGASERGGLAVSIRCPFRPSGAPEAA